MMLLKIKLEPGERFPNLVFSQQFGVREICPKCGEKFTLFFHKSPFDGRKWFQGECENEDCKNRIFLGKRECDLLQPSSQLFSIYYGKDIFKEAKENQKRNNLMEEKRRQEREDRLLLKKRQGLLKSYEVEDIKKYVKERGLE